MHENRLAAGTRPDLLVELTALPQTLQLDLREATSRRGKGRTSETDGGERERGKGRVEGEGRVCPL